MATEADSFRLGKDMKKRLAAWSLILEQDKTAIIREAFSKWEESQTQENKRRIEIIVNELK